MLPQETRVLAKSHCKIANNKGTTGPGKITDTQQRQITERQPDRIIWKKNQAYRMSMGKRGKAKEDNEREVEKDGTTIEVAMIV